MGLHLQRPPPHVLAGVLERARRAELAHGPPGCSLEPASTPTPPGLVRRCWCTELAGPSAFEATGRALQAWAVHRHSGLDVLADGPVAVGTTVALAAPLPIGFATAACRVVAVLDEPGRSGFAYGTLPGHPERGEESFVAERDGALVRFVVVAVSTPAHLLARLVPPVAHRLQDGAARRYLAAARQLSG